MIFASAENLMWVHHKTIVHCHGCFDMLHVGHVRHLELARELGDVLIVTVTSDRYVNKGPGRPMFRAHERAEMLAALRCVDHVGINDAATAIPAIRALRPTIYVKGKEYEGRMTPMLDDEKEAVESVGGKLVFVGQDVCHTTDMLERLRA